MEGAASVDRYNLDSSADRSNCDGVPEHVLSHCPRFVDERKNLEKTQGELPVLEGQIRRMFTCQQDYDSINGMTGSIRHKPRDGGFNE